MDLLCSYCTSSKEDLLQYTPTLLQSILSRFNDPDSKVIETSWNALSAVTKVKIVLIVQLVPRRSIVFEEICGS